MGTKEKIIDISYEHKLSHLGSCLSAANAIETVYEVKKPDEKFILSNGHAALALYVVLLNKGIIDSIPDDFEIHPNRLQIPEVNVSTGSLGQGLPIALGMAMADRNKNVYCMISDGEMAEGSIWESLRIASENKVTNLKVILNANGWAAYRQTDVRALKNQIKAFGWTYYDVEDQKPYIANGLKRDNGMPNMTIVHTNSDIPGFSYGLDSHYKTMSQQDYDKILSS